MTHSQHVWGHSCSSDQSLHVLGKHCRPLNAPFFYHCPAKFSPRLVPAWHTLFFLSRAPMFCCCQGDDFLPETLSLVITAWDKLCWNSWSLQSSTKVTCEGRAAENRPSEESGKVKCSSSFLPVGLVLFFLICCTSLQSQPLTVNAPSHTTFFQCSF